MFIINSTVLFVSLSVDTRAVSRLVCVADALSLSRFGLLNHFRVEDLKTGIM